MLLTLRAFWEWVSGIGLNRDIPEIERPKVRLLNQLLAGTFPIHIVIIVQDFIQRDGPGVLITLVPFAITLITFLFQARGWIVFARVFILFFMTLAMIGLSFFVWERAGSGVYSLDDVIGSGGAF